MKLKLTITIGIIICFSCLYSQERALMPVEEIREVIRLAIDLPELQEYYHTDTDPSRIPLIINEYGLINSENMRGIEKFGKDIEILNLTEIKEKGIINYFHIGDWTYGVTALRLQLSYVAEGILINYRFVRKGEKWIIENSIIMEE